MTNMPEAKLAREAELCYATLALATDYDVWHESEEAVSVEGVIANLLKNVETAKDVIRRAVPAIGLPRTCPCPDLLKNAVITAPHAFPPTARKRLDLLLRKYFPAGPKGRRGAGGSPRLDESRGGPDGSAGANAVGRRRRDQIDVGTPPRGGQSKARTRRG